jgi:hypothetical protein
VANLIGGGLQTQIYVVSLGGWDTHSLQVSSLTDKLTGAQPSLFSKVSKAIAAFEDDLKLMGKADEVMGFVFTEFGRRIKSNDSLGTDHGTTWPAIVFGSKVNPGIIGQNPVIATVVGKSDNLALQNDFRSIYTGFYKQWFNLDNQEITQILGKSFPEIQIIANSTAIRNPSAETTEKIKLWPNPIDDNTQLSFESDGNLSQIMIYSMNGQLIENHLRQKFPPGRAQISLQLTHLAKGTYLLVLFGYKNRETVKFVVR